MPTYGYKCQNKECKFKFEAMQSIKADPLTVCPKCGKELKRIYYPSNFRFGISKIKNQ
jgi:putative FmdB family regulatory protein